MNTASFQLPLTPAEEEWMKLQQLAISGKRKIQRATNTGQRCGTCRFMQRHYYTDRINYCTKGTSARTSNGFASTKRNDWCQLWEAKS